MYKTRKLISQSIWKSKKKTQSLIYRKFDHVMYIMKKKNFNLKSNIIFKTIKCKELCWYILIWKMREHFIPKYQQIKINDRVINILWCYFILFIGFGGWPTDWCHQEVHELQAHASHEIRHDHSSFSQVSDTGSKELTTIITGYHRLCWVYKREVTWLKLPMSQYVSHT